MSDFEYEYNSDNNSDDFDYDNYSYDNDDDNNDDDEHNNVIIDMDSDSNDNCNNSDNEEKTSIINNSKSISTTFESLFSTNNSDVDSNNDSDNDINTSIKISKSKPKKIQVKTSKKKETIVEETKETKDTKETKETKKTEKIVKKEIKLTKKEQSFEFNEETIDFYTKDLYFKKILIKNSSFTNDIAVICLLLKHKLITEYCCSTKKCKVKNVWIDNPIQLILHRKNNIQNDLSSFNLELICGNCYLCMYGLDIFKKKEKEIIFKCQTCGFPLVKFNNPRKKKGICLSCEKKMSKVFTENIDAKFYTNIQGLYDNNPLLSEANKEQNYYRNSGKYKPTTTYKKPSTYNPSTTSKNDTPKETITLNMTTPNLDDLMN
jgi:hypothetical protein